MVNTTETSRSLDTLFSSGKVKKAFLFGNTYENLGDSSLKGVTKDVNDMSMVLEQCGFVYKADTNKPSILEQFQKYLDNWDYNDCYVEFIFYFSGHGANSNGNTILFDNNSLEKGVSLETIIELFDKVEEKVKLEKKKKFEKELKELLLISEDTPTDINFINLQFLVSKHAQLQQKYDELKKTLDGDQCSNDSLTLDNLVKLHFQIEYFENKIQSTKTATLETSKYLNVKFKKLFILDCCRMDIEKFVDSKRFKLNDYDDTAVLYACSPNNKAIIEENSLLTGSLINRINKDIVREVQGRNLCEMAKVVRFDLIQKYSQYFTFSNTSTNTSKDTKIGDNLVEVKKEFNKDTTTSFTQETMAVVFKKSTNLLYGDITVGDFVFFDKVISKGVYESEYPEVE